MTPYLCNAQSCPTSKFLHDIQRATATIAVILWCATEFWTGIQPSRRQCMCRDECSGGEVEFEQNRLGCGDVGHG